MPTRSPLRERVDQQRDQILEIAARKGATHVHLFGSVARGDVDPGSDVDFLVDLTRAWSLFDHIGMQQDLEDLLGCKVDLIVASPLLEHVRTGALTESLLI